MTLGVGIERLKAEVGALEAAMNKADPEPFLVYIENDPQRRHAGPDEVVIGGETYVRGEGEDRDQFEARLTCRPAARGRKVRADKAPPLIDRQLRHQWLPSSTNGVPATS